MTEYNLITYPDKRLRNVCVDVQEINSDFRHMVDRMFEICEEENGLGLSAPQLGDNRSVFILSNPNQVFINPRFTNRKGKVIVREKCLSLPGKSVVLRRSRKVVLEFFNLKGDLRKLPMSGIIAIAAQHEMDHLKGKLITDYDRQEKLYE